MAIEDGQWRGVDVCTSSAVGLSSPAQTHTPPCPTHAKSQTLPQP
eukprot:CAMPEP_0181221284 /NCGR_PEP_ID=MMETSP1096-20121128/29309_1 /TAXON_ID=156174 ORGANISM="Chrysochromulina ericina, Strain CCMP281" /NCGR_SAMPLE_ID=MMETSP1096 /ASSEMBLY_ACC=CAM_ASM_000453 /LENGTH=44 /DNA_ID= /DNA_START= /DNA_END= /DNA_ORIENTATION=